MKWSLYIQKLFKAAEPYLLARGDIIHVRVAHEYARVLMEKEGGNKKIIEPAIILHDVGWSALDPIQIQAAYGVKSKGKDADRLNRIHEREGAVIARQILLSLLYDSQITDQIISIIQRHDSAITARSLEEKIVRDADKLWRFSKIGFVTEIDRQALKASELSQYLSKRYTKWFFTDTAMMIAKKEIKKRVAEIPKSERK